MKSLVTDKMGSQGESRLTNLISFYDKVTQGKSVNVLCFFLFVCCIFF